MKRQNPSFNFANVLLRFLNFGLRECQWTSLLPSSLIVRLLVGGDLTQLQQLLRLAVLIMQTKIFGHHMHLYNLAESQNSGNEIYKEVCQDTILGHRS